jgi:hypothetical protein
MFLIWTCLFRNDKWCFYSFHAISSLTEHESNLFKKLIALRFDNDQNFHVIERQLVLKILIDYYMMHLDGFKTKIQFQKRFFHKTYKLNSFNEWFELYYYIQLFMLYFSFFIQNSYFRTSIKEKDKMSTKFTEYKDLTYQL